jgi:dTDP-4-amino-4,6-dideoxygalactose transaminase
MHKQPALAAFAPTGALPNAEAAAEHCLALPMGPALSGEEAASVAAAVAEALAPAPQ